MPLLFKYIRKIIRPKQYKYIRYRWKGDQIEIDADKNEINILVDEKELSERKKNWKPLSKEEEKGVLSKYADSVASASKGAVTT